MEGGAATPRREGWSGGCPRYAAQTRIKRQLGALCAPSPTAVRPGGMKPLATSCACVPIDRPIAPGAGGSGGATASGVKRRRREGALCAPCVSFTHYSGETTVEGGAQAPPEACQALLGSLKGSNHPLRAPASSTSDGKSPGSRLEQQRTRARLRGVLTGEKFFTDR